MEKKKLTTQEDYRQRVDRVTMYIREHLDREIDIRILADISAFSPFHFHRIMRGYLGEPIGAFIVRTRVEMAAKLLRYSDRTVSDIAYRVGYDAPSSLTKSFCKLFGISPKAYRLTKNYQIIMTTICCMATISGSCQDRIKERDKTEILYVMPAESAPHEGTWLQWPHQYQYGALYRNRIESTWIAMAREIVSGERLHIIAYDAAEKTRIIDQLTKATISLDSIDFYLFKTNDVWVRDNGPLFVRDKAGNLAIEGWGFNGWGEKEGYNYDNLIPKEVATAIKMPFVELDERMILEGGAVELDGKGSLMATRSSVLNSNRNKEMTQQKAENLFTIYLGATHFIWLDGVAGVDITDMHIDGFARFGENNTILTMSRSDLQEWSLSDKDINTLYSALNRDGEPYSYTTLPLTQNNIVTTYGKKLDYKGSYVNYYITNNKVLVPNYNDPNDSVANAIIQTLYPNRRVVGIDVRNLYENGGMIHCVTQQQPR